MDYLEHREHLALVEAWKPRWKTIVVHDLVAEGAPADAGGKDGADRPAAPAR
jgi:hypothetical protein